MIGTPLVESHRPPGYSAEMRQVGAADLWVPVAWAPVRWVPDGWVAAVVERFAAGGWVSWLLLLGLLLAIVQVARFRRRLARLRSRLHGSQIRGGHIAEALAPLLEDFPVDVGKPGTATLFLGQPVDYVHFDPDRGVVFIEVKSGRSGLNERQRRLRQRVEAGDVAWADYRVD